jgi:hypothetical protein
VLSKLINAPNNTRMAMSGSPIVVRSCVTLNHPTFLDKFGESDRSHESENANDKDHIEERVSAQPHRENSDNSNQVNADQIERDDPIRQ